MKELFLRVYEFLAAYNFPTILEAIRQLEWREVARSVYLWLVAVPVLIFLIWTKKVKTLVLLVTFGLFIILLSFTLSPPGEKLPLNDLLTFLGGTAALIGINLYMLFIRE